MKSCPYSHKYQFVRWAYEHISEGGNPRKNLIKLLSKKHLYYLWYNFSKVSKDISRNTLYDMINKLKNNKER